MKVIYPKNFSPSRNKIIIDYCKWKKVLHIWACDAPFTKEKYNWEIWPLLYREIDKVCSNQLWIDLDKESIEFLNSKKEEFSNSEVKFFDMNKLENLDYEPEVIIFGEVIEHLMNLEIALTNLKKVMKEDTLLIISTPNCYWLNHIVNSFFWYDLMHPDHKVYFSYWYLNNLLKYNWLIENSFYFCELDDFSTNKKRNIFWWIRFIFILILWRIFKLNKWTLLSICKKKYE